MYVATLDNSLLTALTIVCINTLSTKSNCNALCKITKHENGIIHIENCRTSCHNKTNSSKVSALN